MNRIDPQMFANVFTSRAHGTWPDKADFVAIDGKTSRRSHDKGAGKAASHLVSAFATTRHLVPGQQAVADKSSETTAIPALLDRLGADDRLKAALVSIDAIATNAMIARAIRDKGADYLLAVKANQPTLRAEIESYFDDAPAESLDTAVDLDKAHGRIARLWRRGLHLITGIRRDMRNCLMPLLDKLLLRRPFIIETLFDRLAVRDGSCLQASSWQNPFPASSISAAAQRSASSRPVGV